jgi:hypothetical protein
MLTDFEIVFIDFAKNGNASPVDFTNCPISLTRFRWGGVLGRVKWLLL